MWKRNRIATSNILIQHSKSPSGPSPSFLSCKTVVFKKRRVCGRNWHFLQVDRLFLVGQRQGQTLGLLENMIIWGSNFQIPCAINASHGPLTFPWLLAKRAPTNRTVASHAGVPIVGLDIKSVLLMIARDHHVPKTNHFLCSYYLRLPALQTWVSHCEFANYDHTIYFNVVPTNHLLSPSSFHQSHCSYAKGVNNFSFNTRYLLRHGRRQCDFDGSLFISHVVCSILQRESVKKMGNNICA